MSHQALLRFRQALSLVQLAVPWLPHQGSNLDFLSQSQAAYPLTDRAVAGPGGIEPPERRLWKPAEVPTFCDPIPRIVKQP